ncbi:MAG: rhodanese-like domain-containing protein [Spirochaetia bacterium]
MKRVMLFVIAAALCSNAVAACAMENQFSDPDALSRLITEKSEPYILVDVRTPEEYASGHIPTAVNFPVSIIAGKLATGERSALVIVYCASGRRSAIAKKTLDDLGFTRVVDFGAISRWRGELVEEGERDGPSRGPAHSG